MPRISKIIPQISVPADTDILAAVQNGQTKRVSLEMLKNYFAKTAQGSNIASASTTDLSTATGNYVHITGTTTITAFGTVTAGTVFALVFDDVLTVTHNGTSLICPGAKNIRTTAGARMFIVSEGSGNWRVLNYLDGTSSVFARATPIIHGATEATTARVLGFRSTDQAVLSERTWEGHRQQSNFADKRNKIYERYRAWLLGGRDREEYKKIVKEVQDFNRYIRENRIRGESYITAQSLRNQARRMMRPSKKERAILQE